jgi:hypothetical protein
MKLGARTTTLALSLFIAASFTLSLMVATSAMALR